MGFIDKLAQKVLGKEDYDDYSVTDVMDGCAGETKISRIRKALEKIVPC